MKLSPLFTWRSALVDSGLRPTVRWVGVCLSLHMSERGDSCFPGLERLARETGYSKSTVAEALAELERTSYLIRVRSKGGAGHTTRYIAVLPTVREADSPERTTVRLTGNNCPGGGQEDVKRTSVREEAKASSRKPRQPDLLWEALEREIGPVTNSAERGRRNKALKHLRESGATPEQIPRVCDQYRTEWPRAALTANAIATNWGHFTANGQAETSLERWDRIAREQDREREERWNEAHPEGS